MLGFCTLVIGRVVAGEYKKLNVGTVVIAAVLAGVLSWRLGNLTVFVGAGNNAPLDLAAISHPQHVEARRKCARTACSVRRVLGAAGAPASAC